MVNLLHSSMSIEELKQECRERGLKVSGTKGQLIRRLGEHSRTNDESGGPMAGLTVDVDVDLLKRPEIVTPKEIKKDVIKTEEDYKAALRMLRDLVAPTIREIEDSFAPVVKAWHEGHRETLKARNNLLKKWEDARAWINMEVARWDREKKLEAERKRQKMIEAQRESAEEEAERKANKLLALGRTEEAQELLDSLFLDEVEPESSPPPPVKIIAPKVSGTMKRHTWQFEIVDEGKVKADYLTPDLKLIGATVRHLGEKAEKVIGGIKVFEKLTVSSRR